jgi:hypothetical protein
VVICFVGLVYINGLTLNKTLFFNVQSAKQESNMKQLFQFTEEEAPVKGAKKNHRMYRNVQEDKDQNQLEIRITFHLNRQFLVVHFILVLELEVFILEMVSCFLKLMLGFNMGFPLPDHFQPQPNDPQRQALSRFLLMLGAIVFLSILLY